MEEGGGGWILIAFTHMNIPNTQNIWHSFDFFRKIASSLVTVHEFWTTYLVIDKEVLDLQ